MTTTKERWGCFISGVLSGIIIGMFITVYLTEAGVL